MDSVGTRFCDKHAREPHRGLARRGRSVFATVRAVPASVTMSKEDSGTTEAQYRKTVELVAYLRNGEWSSWRVAFAELFNEPMFTDQEEHSTTDYYVRAGESTNAITEPVYKALNGQSIAGLDVWSEEETTSNYKLSASQCRMKIRDKLDLTSWLKGSVDGDYDPFVRKVELEDRTEVEQRVHKPELKGMLKHQSEMEAGDKWEDEDAEIPSISVTLTCEATNRERLEWFSNEVVADLMEHLAKHENVKRVRTYSCTVGEEKEGVCYNV